jgi:hypothetical protein
MDWILSALMIGFYWLNGDKWKYVWYYLIGCNLLWIYYAIDIKQYGLIPSSTLICAVAVRNLFKWRQDYERQKSQES